MVPHLTTALTGPLLDIERRILEKLGIVPSTEEPAAVDVPAAAAAQLHSRSQTAHHPAVRWKPAAATLLARMA